MTIGTNLFHALSLRGFSKMDKDIADLQVQISDGRNDPRPSADLVRATRLSAASDQEALLERFQSNVDRAMSRLDMIDSALGGVLDGLQRLNEIAVQGATDTLTPSARAALQVEAVELRDLLVNLANAQDEVGRPLFAGFQTGQPPFQQVDGRITYLGDGARAAVRISESSNIATNLPGNEVFMSVPDGEGGRQDIFSLVDDLARSLASDGAELSETATGDMALSLRLNLSREATNWTINVAGPTGAAQIDMQLLASAPQSAADFINARTSETGVSANIEADGQTLHLSATGPIKVSNLSVQPEQSGVLATAQSASSQSVSLVAVGKGRESLIARTQAALGHMADRRAETGAISGSAESQKDILTERQTTLKEVIAGLEDLDIAAAITDLQKKLVTRDAAHQSYVKITQSSLFDYLR